MLIELSLLTDYTDWQRGKWHGWLRKHGQQTLAVSVGPHGDGRFQNIGESIRHIFSTEQRYVERLSGREPGDTATIPAGDIEALFRFGKQSRKELKEFLETFPASQWDVPQRLEFPNMHFFVKATPRKVLVHVLMHEIRHWAQIATLLRLNGFKGEFHDFLGSPVLGGEFGPL